MVWALAKGQRKIMHLFIDGKAVCNEELVQVQILKIGERYPKCPKCQKSIE